MPPQDPALLINILSEPKTMRIQSRTINLEVQTTLSSAGLRVMAEELAKLAESVPSASHAITYRSMARAFDAQAERRDAVESYEDQLAQTA